MAKITRRTFLKVLGASTTASNGYAAWTPRLLRAAYNFHYSVKDPGAFAHNAR